MNAVVESATARDVIQLTPTDRRILGSLVRRYKYFMRKGRKDFFIDDEKLAYEEFTSPKTVQRSRKRLKGLGLIEYTVGGKFRGNATTYRVIDMDKAVKMSTFRKAVRWSNCPDKVDKMSPEGGQNVQPNIVINIENNRGEISQEEIKFFKTSGWDTHKIKEHYVTVRGYSESMVDVALGKRF